MSLALLFPGKARSDDARAVTLVFAGSGPTTSGITIGDSRTVDATVPIALGTDTRTQIYFELHGKLPDWSRPGLIYSGPLPDPRGEIIERTMAPIELIDEGVDGQVWDSESRATLVIPAVPGSTLKIWRRTPENQENPRELMAEQQY